ncbi:oligosaccharide flippase family protein [Brenneria goodwinii]|uniref:Membrane protein involved in the export of O-antigen and teichoic acid n=1 Tax=Brenneria goodwinii TaxID=1109412 RepID=A0A0G4JP05_9GAMM|nr:oligosaccharide flippase family protein [Brenneria goodwinii]CPR13639.1 Membrane protein involved in the export of O-antigen and teichoic acid [Brenneria goodwinii]
MNDFIKSRFVINISWNLLGFVVPIISAILAIPFLIKNIGLERFGILTLIFSLIGFMNVFDFGLTRAITRSVVKYKDDKNRLLSSIKTGWFLLLCVLLCISISLLFANRYISETIFNPSNKIIEQEINHSLIFIALSLPFVISQSVFVGVMEGCDAFKKISLGRIPFSLLMYLVPVTISFFIPSLSYITFSLCILRVIMAIIFYLLMSRELIKISKQKIMEAKISKNICFELIKYGGWVSVSNIIAPIMLYIDRFFVSSIIGASVVAYYTTPYEIVSKMSIVAVSISGVLFPLLSSKIFTDINSANKYFLKATFGIFFVLIIPVLLGLFLSKTILELWIDHSFAEQSYIIFCGFLIGFLIHGLMQPAFTWIQASGKPFITALAHVFDILLYVFYFPYLTKHYGTVGAVSAWVLRVSISLLVLHSIRFFLYKRGLNEKI